MNEHTEESAENSSSIWALLTDTKRTSKSARRVVIRNCWYSFESMARSATSSMVSVAGDTPLLEISVAFSACERASSQSLNPWIQGINKWSNQAEEALTIASVWFSQTAAFLPYNALCLW